MIVVLVDRLAEDVVVDLGVGEAVSGAGLSIPENRFVGL